MKTKCFHPIFVCGILLIAAVGSDHGFAEVHKVYFEPRATSGGHALAKEDAERRLEQLVREQLAGKGFDELPGKPYIWTRRGAWIEVSRDKEGQLVLQVSAVGSNRDVQVAKRMEAQLITFLKQQSGVNLQYFVPPQPLW
jgi:hypothetical protein